MRRAKNPNKTRFQSTRPVRGGTTGGETILCLLCISIHPPRAGRDFRACPPPSHRPGFQSTRPVRGGTAHCVALICIGGISIHPPRAGRDRARRLFHHRKHISIHPPRAGRDSPPSDCSKDAEISIHPPRAGRDLKADSRFRCALYFNPPAPCGAGRPPARWKSDTLGDFNPPAPCGAGRSWSSGPYTQTHFNPPAPCGAGLGGGGDAQHRAQISIHPPRAGRDAPP